MYDDSDIFTAVNSTHQTVGCSKIAKTTFHENHENIQLIEILSMSLEKQQSLDLLKYMFRSFLSPNELYRQAHGWLCGISWDWQAFMRHAVIVYGPALLMEWPLAPYCYAIRRGVSAWRRKILSSARAWWRRCEVMLPLNKNLASPTGSKPMRLSVCKQRCNTQVIWVLFSSNKSLLIKEECFGSKCPSYYKIIWYFVIL